jgi:hypothetical protein
MQKGTLFASTKSARRLGANIHFAILFSIANIQTVRWLGSKKETLRAQLILRDFIILSGSFYWVALQGLAFGIPRVVRR